jgi:FtsZ-binding cell division protein ZapB
MPLLSTPERTRAEIERDKARAGCMRLAAAHEAYRHKCHKNCVSNFDTIDALLTEHDFLKQERDEVTAERDKLKAERDEVTAERDFLKQELEELKLFAELMCAHVGVFDEEY